jgi:hypothetical protein
MQILTVSAIALIGAALISGQAVGASFGTLTLQAGETQTIDIGADRQNWRVCNDSFSSGPIVVTIAGNVPHDLSPGVCAEGIGDQVTIQSHARGLAAVEFRTLSDTGAFSK